jgi:hypothetical protein
VAGLAVVAVSLAFVPWNPTRSCGVASVNPILGFELATSADDLWNVFGPEGPCRDAIVSAFRIENEIDFAYMIAYGAFLSCGIAALRARGDTRLLQLGTLAAVFAPLADAVENACLLSMNVAAPGRWLGLLAVSPFRLMGPPVFNDMGHGEQERVTEGEHASNAVVMEAVSEGAEACPVSW